MSLIDVYCQDASMRGMGAETIDWYRWSLRGAEQFATKPLEDLGRPDIRAYVDHLRQGGRTTKTIDNHLTALSSFFEYLIFEEIVTTNPVLPVKKRYLATYKTAGEKHTRKIISVEEASRLVNYTVDIRDKALIVFLLKTGCRISEALAIDVDELDLEGQSVLLKPKKKRSNRLVFFDDEAESSLRCWLDVRRHRGHESKEAVFVTRNGRMSPHAANYALKKSAIVAGLHDVNSTQLEDHFSPHCCRHTWVTWLLKNGMRREYVQWLRGDAPRDAIDGYHHINSEDVRELYLDCIPRLGV
jgi:integrase/recombinase XerD